MPGWLIQGVRGEGKSLAAVNKIRQYMVQGRPVATNLDLFLEKLLPADCPTIAYRLPDFPRLVDFQMLPAAYDVKYKPDDKNGLLVLDEMGTWLNSRNWNDKERLKLMNWLFLSRKMHWDIILLAQDFEMIDAQARSTLCDFLVQSTRADRQKIPFFSGILKTLGFNHYMPKSHKYFVYYGMSTATPPQDTWTITGEDIYHGYDTNQLFKDGLEPLVGTLVDMRATYSYIPVNYLTRDVFVKRLEAKINNLNNPLSLSSEAVTVAKKVPAFDTTYLKIGVLGVFLVAFIAWRLLRGGGMSLPNSSAAAPAAAPGAAVSAPAAAAPAAAPASAAPAAAPAVLSAPRPEEAIKKLLATYRPRLSSSAYSAETGFIGNIEFYNNMVLVETFSMQELHALGGVFVRKPYGLDLIFDGQTFMVNAWLLPSAVALRGVDPAPVPPVLNQQPTSMTPKIF